MACTLPLATVMSMSRLATTPGKRLVIPRSSTAGAAVVPPVPWPGGEPVSLGVVMASLLVLGGLLGGLPTGARAGGTARGPPPPDPPGRAPLSQPAGPVR